MIDSHCHWDFDEFDPDAFGSERTAQLSAFAEAGVSQLLLLGVAPWQWPRLHEMAASYGASPCRLLLAFGVHPCWAEPLQLDENRFKDQLLSALLDSSGAQKPNVVAIGECGVDGAIAWSEAEQEQLFRWHAELAVELKLPLLVHAHRGHNAVLRVLSRCKPSAGGVIHAFAGSSELARQYWKLGFHLGVGGTITYPRASKTRATLAAVPIESLILETDAPDMPLCGFQGQVNTPLQLPRIAEALAELRGLPLSDIQQITHANTERLLGLA